MTVHRIKLKDLNQKYLEKLQASIGDGEQEIAIWVPQKSNTLSEDTFWTIIALLDWKQKETQEILAPAILQLSQFSTNQIKAFDDLLSEKLYFLDGQKYDENTGQNAYKGKEASFSIDGFLYARCLVVAMGEERYTQILSNPTLMIKDDSFEPLLSLAQLAYQKKTGRTYEHTPTYIYETFANTKGWNNQDFLSNLLS